MEQKNIADMFHGFGELEGGIVLRDLNGDEQLDVITNARTLIRHDRAV